VNPECPALPPASPSRGGFAGGSNQSQRRKTPGLITITRCFFFLKKKKKEKRNRIIYQMRRNKGEEKQLKNLSVLIQHFTRQSRKRMAAPA